MISNSAGILIFLSVCGIVSSIPNRVVDCRKFVFAPLCRGVAAKRDTAGPGLHDTAALFKEDSAQYLLRYLYPALGFLGEDVAEGETRKSTRQQRELEHSPKIYQEEMNPLLKLLFESRSGSGRDYSPAQEIENF